MCYSLCREHVKEYLMNVISNKSSDTVLYQRVSTSSTREEKSLVHLREGWKSCAVHDVLITY